MTIHKGQGQSMLRVGVYVVQQMFAHGQLYVAVSRAIVATGLKMFVEGGKNLLKNIVYKEIL
jgi:ATP-dependent DNA helicase PIF1